VQSVQHFCSLKGVRPTVACTESGAGRNFMTDIKNEKKTSLHRVELLATYLDVSASQLLGEPEPNANKGGPNTISDAEAALNEELITRLCRLTPEELARVDAFVQGILTAR